MVDPESLKGGGSGWRGAKVLVVTEIGSETKHVDMKTFSQQVGMWEHAKSAILCTVQCYNHNYA